MGCFTVTSRYVHNQQVSRLHFDQTPRRNRFDILEARASPFPRPTRDRMNIDKPDNQMAFNALQAMRARLLDLTGRNPLLNYAHRKTSSIRFLGADPTEIASSLLDEYELAFDAVPLPPRSERAGRSATSDADEDSPPGSPISAVEWAKRVGLPHHFDASVEDSDTHDGDKLLAALYLSELDTVLKHLYKKANSAVQETGANILYLACGFLEWYDREDSDKKKLAPLYLVPVQLTKVSSRKADFTLSYTGENVLSNLSLREKLRIDFGIELPDAADANSAEWYFEDVSERVQDEPRWKVHRFVSLGLFHFSTLLMYQDLDPDRWPADNSLLAHPLISEFLGGGSSRGDDDESGYAKLTFGTEYEIDTLDTQKYSLIYDADSSQHSALVDAIDGKNLVIEGPPGTGKSQTITNLIAAAMADGKTVLFVAEKLAALEVVKDRLDAAGLADFCLELHSHNTRKRNVLDSIEYRVNAQERYVDVSYAFSTKLNEYQTRRDRLNEHSESVNRVWRGTERTPHQIFTTAVRLREAAAGGSLFDENTSIDIDNYTPAAHREIHDAVSTFETLYAAVEGSAGANVSVRHHPWWGVSGKHLQSFDDRRLHRALSHWQSGLVALQHAWDSTIPELGSAHLTSSTPLAEIRAAAASLANVPSPVGDELFELLPFHSPDFRETLAQYVSDFDAIQQTYKNLSARISSDVLSDGNALTNARASLDRLQRYSDLSTSIRNIHDGLAVALRAQTQLQRLSPPTRAIQQVVGPLSGSLLTLSVTGSRHFSTFLGLVRLLDASYWSMRGPHFDDDTIDHTIGRLTSDLERLHALESILQGSVQFDELPIDDTIPGLWTTVRSGGAFRWFNPSWHTAKNRLLEYAVASKDGVAALETVSGPMIDYVCLKAEILHDVAYSTELGDSWQGLDTDVNALMSVRGWYRSVRVAFGREFSPLGPLADSLFAMDARHARAICTLDDQGFLETFAEFVDDILLLRGTFNLPPSLHDDSSELGDESGPIRELLRELSDVLQSCVSTFHDVDSSLSSLHDLVSAADELRLCIQTWSSTADALATSNPALRLKPGLHEGNAAPLCAIRHTLALVDAVEQNVRDARVKAAVEDNFTSLGFKKLARIRDELSPFLDEERTAFEEFSSLGALNVDAWSEHSGTTATAVQQRNEKALASLALIPSWLNYSRVREKVIGLGLIDLVDSVESSKVASTGIVAAFEAGVYDQLSRKILSEMPELNDFSASLQSRAQQDFSRCDADLIEKHREHIAFKIAQRRIPSGIRGNRVSEHSEFFLLKHEWGKKTRHIPLRQLLKRAGRAVIALKPCFMMGPMSVAQFLEPGSLKFDLVIMDEASQIRPQDALGVIARGAQVVIVGDPKQLPPTSFFSRTVDEEEEDEDTIGMEESESILDAALPMFPSRRLRWHYRSRHESLIAFSNQSFYDNDLVLFPSPEKTSPDFGIKFSRLRDGVFAGSINVVEATAIAQAVRTHFIETPADSIGVVAMNAKQRDHIEAAIASLAMSDSVFDMALQRDEGRNRESLFIKNLENVQGDERDVILISMTYGPSQPGGKVFQRFGPINTDVGWRRLNVLLTRSKKRMHVFSSMGSDDVLVSGESKKGVTALREFLAYCETGILHSTQHATGRAPDSDFEVSVIQALQRAGFTCVPQVGVSGYYIDIAVLDPKNSGRYLMGIECDGATYHSAKSARDRDRLRQMILEQLGWRIRRIWSTDWFRNPDAQLAPIIQELRDIARSS